MVSSSHCPLRSGSRWECHGCHTGRRRKPGRRRGVTAALFDASGNPVAVPSSILMQDGGTAANHGIVTMDVSQLDIPFHLVGGPGDDIDQISETMADGTSSLGTSVTPGTATNELDVLSPQSSSVKNPVYTVLESNGLFTLDSALLNQLQGTQESSTSIQFQIVPLEFNADFGARQFDRRGGCHSSGHHDPDGRNLRQHRHGHAFQADFEHCSWHRQGGLCVPRDTQPSDAQGRGQQPGRLDEQIHHG